MTVLYRIAQFALAIALISIFLGIVSMATNDVPMAMLALKGLAVAGGLTVAAYLALRILEGMRLL